MAKLRAGAATYGTITAFAGLVTVHCAELRNCGYVRASSFGRCSYTKVRYGRRSTPSSIGEQTGWRRSWPPS